MAEPHCPECKTSGLGNVVSSASTETNKSGDPWFHIAHCNSCGHVYGVFTKRVTVNEIERLVTVKGSEGFCEFLVKAALIATGRDDD